MKIVLDTNVLAEFIKPQGLTKVKNWVATQPRENLFTTSITQAEILYGIAILPDGKRSQDLREAAQRMFIEDFSSQIISFELSPIVFYGSIHNRYHIISRCLC